MKISAILATKRLGVIVIQPDQTLREAIALLIEHNIGSLVVVNETGKPVGIITERDIIRQAAVNESLFTQAVSEVMTRNPIVGLPQDDLESVAHTMTEKRFRHLPILEGEKLVGIVSIGDVVKAQRDRYLGEVHTLQTQISGE